jgi:hypothetical protein
VNAVKTVWRRFSIEHLWCLTVLVGVFAFVNTHPIRPHDFWWHMAIGRESVQTGRIPTVDTYSYTAPGQPYPSYQMFWLAEVGLYALFSAGGPELVVFAHSLVITTAYGLILWVCGRVTGNWRSAAFGALFAAALGINDWNVRPQAITFLLGALFIAAIQSLRMSGGATPSQRRGVQLALFPLGMAVWVNCHGSFPLGLALVSLWFVAESWSAWKMHTVAQLRRPGAALALSILTCLFNPRGPGVWAYLATMAGSPVIQKLVPEWAPPSFDSLDGALFFVGLLFCAALLALSPRRPGVLALLTFLGFATLGLRTTRGSVWFGLAMAPIAAEHLEALASQFYPKRRTTVSSKLNLIVAGLLLFLGLITLPWFKSALPLPTGKAGVISTETPVVATDFLLAERLPGRVFHAMPYGSYLAWAAQPDYPVFVDSRLELYAVDVWLDYIQISNAQGNWEAVLEAYGVNTLMLSRDEQGTLIQAVEAAPRWTLLYEDLYTVIYSQGTR